MKSSICNIYVSCWTTYILQDDTRSLQCQVEVFDLLECYAASKNTERPQLYSRESLKSKISWIIDKRDIRVWTGFVWLRTGVESYEENVP